MAVFGLFFTGASYPIAQEHLMAVDATHWVLDVAALVRQEYWTLKEVALFLLAPGLLDPGLALALYVKVGTSEFLYRGCVHAGHPSEVMPTEWPSQTGDLAQSPEARLSSEPVQVGIALEPLADVAAKQSSRLGERVAFARRVGLHLLRYLESFATQTGGDSLLIPTNALDRWWGRFEARFRLDPEFLVHIDEAL